MIENYENYHVLDGGLKIENNQSQAEQGFPLIWLFFFSFQRQQWEAVFEYIRAFVHHDHNNNIIIWGKRGEKLPLRRLYHAITLLA